MFPCPCCGYYTLTECSPGTRQRCPVCYWFDCELVATYDRWELWVSQVTFEKLGACAAEYTDRTRRPRLDESRDPRHAIDEEPERLRIALLTDAEQKVRNAFADVTPLGRVTLGEAYRGEVNTKHHPWDWNDHDEHWWEIPDEVLDASARLAGIFSHGNYVSCVYYIAAYLMKDLRTQDNAGLFAITRPRWHGLNGDTRPPESLLTSPQLDAVTAFLRHNAIFTPTPHTRDAATRSIPRFELPIGSET